MGGAAGGAGGGGADPLCASCQPLHSPPLDSYRVDLETNSEDANTQLVLSFNAPAHCEVSWDLDWVSLTPGVNWSHDGVYTPYDLTLLQVGEKAR